MISGGYWFIIEPVYSGFAKYIQPKTVIIKRLYIICYPERKTVIVNYK